MKTMRLYTAAATGLTFLGLAWGGTALADEANPPAQKECSPHEAWNTFKGSVTAVDAPDHIVTVKGFLFTRNFNTANDCKVSLQDKAAASLADLRPGQQVDIRYVDNHGVRIAKDIAQHDLMRSGHITAIDPVKGTLALREGLMTRSFAMAPNCAVVLRDNKAGMLANLQIGDDVNVVYEPARGLDRASRIEMKGAMFTGTIEAIDATTHSIKAKGYNSEKRFNLANDCPIVINGQASGSWSNLRIGEQVRLNYENDDGVLVANSLSTTSGAISSEPKAPAPTQQTARTGNDQWHANYGYYP